MSQSCGASAHSSGAPSSRGAASDGNWRSNGAWRRGGSWNNWKETHQFTPEKKVRGNARGQKKKDQEVESAMHEIESELKGGAPNQQQQQAHSPLRPRSLGADFDHEDRQAEREKTARTIKALKQTRSHMEPGSRRHEQITGWIEEEVGRARGNQPAKITQEELRRTWAEARVSHQRAQKQMRVAQEQLERAQQAENDAKDAYNRFAGPEDRTSMAADAFRSVLDKVRLCTRQNEDGTVTVANPNLLDTLVNLTCTLGQSAVPVASIARASPVVDLSEPHHQVTHDDYDMFDTADDTASEQWLEATEEEDFAESDDAVQLFLQSALRQHGRNQTHKGRLRLRTKTKPVARRFTASPARSALPAATQAQEPVPIALSPVPEQQQGEYSGSRNS